MANTRCIANKLEEQNRQQQEQEQQELQDYGLLCLFCALSVNCKQLSQGTGVPKSIQTAREEDLSTPVTSYCPGHSPRVRVGVCLPLLKTLLCLCSEAWVRSPLAANPGLALVHGWSACCASLERLAFG